MSFFDYLSLWHIVPGIAVRVRVKGPSLRYVPQGPRRPLRASFGKKLGSGSGLASLGQPNASLEVSGVSPGTQNVSLILLTSKLSSDIFLEPIKCPGDLWPQVSM